MTGTEKSAARGFAESHPYLSTVWGPGAASLAGSALGGPIVGSVAGLGTEIGGTHALTRALAERRERAGAREDERSKEFVLRHPYFTGIGSRIAGGAAGGALGGLGAFGLARHLTGGKGEYTIPGTDKTIPIDILAGLMGLGLGNVVGGTTGRALATSAILRAQERELERLRGRSRGRRESEEKRGSPMEGTMNEKTAMRNLQDARVLGRVLAEHDLQDLTRGAMKVAARLAVTGKGSAKTAQLPGDPDAATLALLISQYGDQSIDPAQMARYLTPEALQEVSRGMSTFAPWEMERNMSFAPEAWGRLGATPGTAHAAAEAASRMNIPPKLGAETPQPPGEPPPSTPFSPVPPVETPKPKASPPAGPIAEGAKVGALPGFGSRTGGTPDVRQTTDTPPAPGLAPRRIPSGTPVLNPAEEPTPVPQPPPDESQKLSQIVELRRRQMAGALRKVAQFSRAS